MIAQTNWTPQSFPQISESFSQPFVADPTAPPAILMTLLVVFVALLIIPFEVSSAYCIVLLPGLGLPRLWSYRWYKTCFQTFVPSSSHTGQAPY